MFKIWSTVIPIVIAFFTFANLAANAHEDHVYEDTQAKVYDTCLGLVKEQNSDLNALIKMGVLKSPSDVDTLCSCWTQTAIKAHTETDTYSEYAVAVEQGMLQCLQPRIKPFVTDNCIAAAADRGVTDMTQMCDCLGEHVESHSANNTIDFFNDPDKYLEASAQYCHLYE